jgi:hypothetical protein
MTIDGADAVGGALSVTTVELVFVSAANTIDGNNITKASIIALIFISFLLSMYIYNKRRVISC